MWAQFIEAYGYLAVFVGSILEGETILVLAGFSVSLGYLEATTVFLLAVAGGMLGDATYYFLGRRYGPRVIRRFPGLRRVRARAVLFLRRWGRFAAFMTRFAYGLRIVLPMMMGAARMRPALFFTFNFMGAVSFAALYLTLGFLFGEAMEELLGRVRPYERWIVLGLILTGVTLWIARKWRLYRTAERDVLAAAALLRAEREEGRGKREEGRKE
jgi:membrane protein DedA with SNARE-associated domain